MLNPIDAINESRGYRFAKDDFSIRYQERSGYLKISLPNFFSILLWIIGLQFFFTFTD